MYELMQSDQNVLRSNHSQTACSASGTNVLYRISWLRRRWIYSVPLPRHVRVNVTMRTQFFFVKCSGDKTIFQSLFIKSLAGNHSKVKLSTTKLCKVTRVKG